MITEITVAWIGAAASVAAAAFSGAAAWRAAAIGRRATETAANITRQGTEAAAEISRLGTETAANIAAAGTEVAAQLAAEAEVATNDKSIFVGSVTNERSTWRSELRAASVIVTTALRSSAIGLKVEWQDVLKGCAEITLRLNPITREEPPAGDDDHRKDRAVHRATRAVLSVGPRERKRHGALAEDIERAVQALLKQEWQVSKTEAQSGLLATEAVRADRLSEEAPTGSAV